MSCQCNLDVVDHNYRSHIHAWRRREAARRFIPACLRDPGGVCCSSPSRPCKIHFSISTKHHDACIYWSKLPGLPYNLCQCSILEYVSHLASYEGTCLMYLTRIALSCLLYLLPASSHVLLIQFFPSGKTSICACCLTKLLACSQNNSTLAAINLVVSRALWYFAVRQIYKGHHSSRAKVSSVSSS
jgi:hypothetical protein